MGKFSLNKRLTSAKPMENGLMWYECAEYGEVKEYIKGNLQKIQENFVSVGYWLKYVKDNRMYVEDGYKSIEEFAQAVYQISKSTTYRLMEINTNFSKNGNSPELAEEYKDFSKSQLQELLTLTDSQREEVTPEMTVDEIRQVKKENQPGDGMIRALCHAVLRGKFEKTKDIKVLSKHIKEYLHRNLGKTYTLYGDGHLLHYRCNPRGITFSSPAEGKEYDEITWAALTKRIMELYETDPLTLEFPDTLDGQMEIVNVDMEVKEYNSRQDALPESKEEPQYEEVMPKTDEAVKAQEKIQEPENLEEEQEPVPSQESVCSEESKKPYQRGCITGANPYGRCACCGAEGVQCCAACKEDCNGRCGWYHKSAAEKDDDSQGKVSFSEIPDEIKRETVDWLGKDVGAIPNEGTEPNVGAEPDMTENKLAMGLDVITILTYSNAETDCIPFSDEKEMFILDEGKKCAMTMKMQKYIATQLNFLDLSQYRLEIRAVKIED